MNKKAVILITLFIVTSFGGLTQANASNTMCDRECLKGFLTQYLDALIAKKFDALPLDATVKFTENCKTLKLGEGYWKDVSGTVRYRLDFVDVNQSGIGALVVIKGTASVLFAIRLKIANQKINEIETIVTRNSTEGMLFTPDNFKTPGDSDITKMPKPELLNTRAEMISIASKYPEAMKKKLKNFNANGLYFPKNAYRLENGNRMAGPGCTMGSGCENIGTQGLPPLPEMVYQPVLVDEEAGIVALRLNFGKGSLMSGSGELDVLEAFKVFNDSMHCVYAIMRVVPEGTDFGWVYNSTGTVNDNVLSKNIENNRTVSAKAHGVSVRLELPCDKMILEMYTVTGKLVLTKTAFDLPKNNAVFIPINMSGLPRGHFIGCVRSFAGGKRINSQLFQLNSIR